MKQFLASPWTRYLVAVVAGLMLAAAFPKFGVAGFAWVAPALLLAAAHGKTGFTAFRIGFVGGLVSNLVQFYWLLLIPVKGFPILGWLALSAYLSLFPAIWVWLLSAVDEFETNDWLQRTNRALGGAAAWVALELLRGWAFGGMPWNLLGQSQYLLTPLIQVAAYTGVYGVSFLAVWGSLSLFNGVQQLLREPKRRMIWQAEIFLPLAVVIAAFVFGSARIHGSTRNETSSTATHPEINVAFIQPSIPQTMIWDDGASGKRFDQLLDQTRQALAANTSNSNKPPADLVLWPEAALPSVGQAELTRLADIVREHQAWMLLGMDDVFTPPGATTESQVQYFNASALLNPRGEPVAVYHKRKLVMFGEFVPAIKWLPFLQRLTPITGGFTPGDKPVFFRALARGRGVKFSSLICFEDIFPDFTRAYVDEDTDFIVNLTNNGWFGEGAAQWQHAAAAVFRTVENGRPLLRCSNNGLTCWVDEFGRIQQTFHDEKGTIYGAGVMHAAIPLLDAGKKHTTTFYNSHGNWFAWACVAASILMLLSRLSHFGPRKWGDV